MKKLIITCGLTCIIYTQVNASRQVPFKEVKYFCKEDNTHWIKLSAVEALKPGFKTTYSWSHGLGNEQSVIFSEEQIASGSVTCTQQCECGGIAFSSIELSFERFKPTFSISVTNPECHGLNGTASLIAQSGVASVLWESGSKDMITHLSAGTHTVRVYDYAGCYTNSTITLTEPDSFTLTKNYLKEIKDVSCFGLANGSTELKFSDSSLNTRYQYKWSTGTTGRKNTGLKAGNLVLNVKNKEGGCVTIPFLVKQPEQLNVNYKLSNYNGQEISCAGLRDGLLTYWITGGTKPYTTHPYKITSAKDKTILYRKYTTRSESVTLDSLSAGNYNIPVTDSMGCTIDESIRLSEPEPITIFHMPAHNNNLDITCNGHKDIISPSITGGSGQYSYLWTAFNKHSKVYDTVANSANPSLNAGDYHLTVNDGNGCTEKQTVTVLQADALDYTSKFINFGFIKLATIRFLGGYGNKYYLPNGKRIKSKTIFFFGKSFEKKIVITNGDCERELIISFDTHKTKLIMGPMVKPCR